MKDIGKTTIRKATKDDAATLHALTVALAEEIGSSMKMQSTAQDCRTHGFSESPFFEAILAETDGRACGLCIYFYTYSSWRGEPGIYVQDLYVGSGMRGTGLGKELLAKVVMLGKEKGATHLRLCVDHENSAAQDFYRAIGFKWRDDDHVYETDGRAFHDLATGL